MICELPQPMTPALAGLYDCVPPQPISQFLISPEIFSNAERWEPRCFSLRLQSCAGGLGRILSAVYTIEPA